jgi:hypothetical protein
MFLVVASPRVLADVELISVKGGKVQNFQVNAHGTWGSKKARASLSAKTLDGSEVMLLQYNVEQPQQDGGAWFGFSHFDIRSYDFVEFRVRGAKGGEMLAFGLKDDRWFEHKLPVADYLPGGITTEWQTVRMPLKDFEKLRQRYSLDNWSL